MKNHYISQFIIKRFSSAINIFNVSTGKIDEGKRPDKVFYKNDLFDLEMEKLFNTNIESRVANILDKKILDAKVIQLTREDLFTLKRYMLISSVRSMDAQSFCKLIKSFKKNAEQYISMYNEYNSLPSLCDLNENDNDIYLRTLKVFASTTTIKDIAKNSLATREMVAWALPFLESYLAFWDCPNEKEFILTDCGMCSEYEGFHMLTGGLDISKTSYLLHKVLKEKKDEYVALLSSNFVMYENYSIFNLSSTRCMIMINPFFRLYQNQRVQLVGDTIKTYILEKPDIWPAIIQNKKLFEIPENKYIFSETFMCKDDIFIYTPKELNHKEVIYINSILLSQTKEIIGFNNPMKIIDSIYYFVWYKGNFESVKKLEEGEKEIAFRLMENVVKSPFRSLCDYCDHKGGINKTEFIFLFEELLENIYKDFRENPYICEYYLDNTAETEKCQKLNFLEQLGYSKIEYFKKHLIEIQKCKHN